MDYFIEGLLFEKTGGEGCNNQDDGDKDGKAARLKAYLEGKVEE